ncbi:hypothetical protein CAEBREN_07887 [Caenorhabditis brenneri]|uniref:C2H2-type domain-containing protein n=1 Tax=Caenorhabditis brenneri TaxID=135651 RepID=G0PFR1_CAEBE|nr:hypothetical protein CAEBREN_07887 [Caenorhabditis brenneri]
MTGAISEVTSASTSSATESTPRSIVGAKFASMTGPITGSLLRSIISGSTSPSNSASTSGATFGSMPRSMADATASTTSATSRTTSESMDPGPAPPPPPRTLKRTRAQSVHTPKQADPNLKCSECAHQSVTLSELALHRQTIHRKPPHSCNFCPRVFRTQRALYDHHMTEIGRWKCSKCNKVVNRKYLLHFHERYCGKKAEPK